MKRTMIVGLAIALASTLLSAPPASACEACTIRILCVIDECWLVESCVTVNSTRRGRDCEVVFPGICMTSGEFCQWASLGPEPPPFAASTMEGWTQPVTCNVGP